MGNNRRRLYSIIGGWLMSGEVLYCGRLYSGNTTLSRSVNHDKEMCIIFLTPTLEGNYDYNSSYDGKSGGLTILTLDNMITPIRLDERSTSVKLTGNNLWVGTYDYNEIYFRAIVLAIPRTDI